MSKNDVHRIGRAPGELFNSGGGDAAAAPDLGVKDKKIAERKDEFEQKADQSEQRAYAAGAVRSGNEADLLGFSGLVGTAKRNASRALLG